MGGIILVIAVILVDVMIRAVATVALTLTGLDRQTASFQALSALTGTGFTTKEAELVVNHPVRRRIISFLMIIGNAGFVVVVAGLVTSFLNITSPWSLIRFGVLAGAVYLIFKMATYTKFARFLSRKIEEKLKERYKLQKVTVDKVLDLGEDFGVAEVTLSENSSCVGKTLASSDLGRKKILVLAIERKGERILVPRGHHILQAGDNLICYGSFKDMMEIT
ncbi:TrkA C-terminal domain-containing protein [Candidatus Aerophobetes bacterium]|nr:TrkA C-terminal domain-containing protein [Candidatus Aerophobetes bacterium]